MPLQPAALESYLHEHIPLSKAMEVSVARLDGGGITLAAPLAPNINHQQTVFGGSAATLAVLAAWSSVHCLLQDQQIPSRIVIQASHMDYLLPMESCFEARCPAPSADQTGPFLKTLKKFSRARLSLPVDVLSGGVLSARFHGTYVAFKR